MKRFVILLLPLVATGCASALNIGESEYSCRGYAEGAKCISSREIYEQTHDKDHLISYVEEDAEKQDVGGSEDTAAAEKAKKSAMTNTSNSEANAIPKAQKPIPVRSNAKVMRIYVASWEDKDGDLHGGEHIFTEVVSRSWSIGSQYTPGYDANLTPLQILKEPAKAPEAGNKKN